MNKPYSNKALPAGTVLREWRLEEVLGVGGFGIVYKGRGIYFDELVAIKEYFPSSISERDAEDTVVPIDSDAEEVHALGLKKFVEEAKLLWNLSTPTRHPNIVSVRSLFEIHGTAYMVMDFEDGVALSKMLKEGTKFNERSLWNIIHPVAEGLDRAHRVGVLHRDIKPPNILINDDGRPVLIDFGSARFEAAEATSTKVTFHTPPYAAIEQYVKTYPQGPWTDIYALGVVLYECVTGKKPPEVLERMHGGADERLSERSWPGYSKQFLAAIDAAMTIRPQERPQSISEWLEMFGKSRQGTKKRAVEVEQDDATRVFTHELAAEEIMPVAAPASALAEAEPVETAVPDDPSAVQFKRAGQETAPRRKALSAPAALLDGPTADVEAPKAPEEPRARKPDRKAAPEPVKDSSKQPKKLSPALIGGAAVALLAVGAGGVALLGGGQDSEVAPSATRDVALASGSAGMGELETLAPALRALADDASRAGAPLSAVTGLTAASEQIAQQFQSLRALSADPANSAAVNARTAQLRQLAARAEVEFAQALLSDAEGKAKRLSGAVPWANPASESAAQRESASRQQIAANLRTSLAQLRSAVAAAERSRSPVQAHDYARLALTQAQTFTAASLAAYNNRDISLASTETVAPPPERTSAGAAAPAPSARRPTQTTATAASTTAASTSSATTLSPGKIDQLNSVIDDARGMARQVIRMGRRSGSGSDVLRENARLAENYDQNLRTLKDSGRGVRSDREADRLIAQARQTRAYVQFLLNQSNKAR